MFYPLLIYNYDNKIDYKLVIDTNSSKIKEKLITYTLLYYIPYVCRKQIESY